MGNEIAAAFRLPLRIMTELFLWLPVWLILTTADSVVGRLGMLAAAVAAFVIGILLYKLPRAWNRIALIAMIIALIALGFMLFRNELPAIIWMGLLLWRGRYPRLYARHYGVAFLICCAAVIVASQNDLLPIYNLTFTALALIWVVVWFVSLNKGMLDDAGLHNRIVTRSVRLASRKYLLAFLAGALLIFALTVGYGKQLLTPPALSSSDRQWVDLDQLQPQPAPPAEQNPMLPIADQGKRSVIWDVLFWVLAVAASLGAIWFARMLWKDRTWTWQGILKAVREWFLKEKTAETLPYVEERRSLSKDKKKGPSRWDRWFRRPDREREWDRLDNPQKVRRLYEETVMSGIEQGYRFEAHHTPAETLEGLVQWGSSEKRPEKTKGAYWQRLLSIRFPLLQLYEKAKYSPHDVTEQDVKSLRKPDTD